jgi:hypothetical protein
MFKIAPRAWPFGRFSPKKFSSDYNSVFGGISLDNVELTGTITHTPPSSDSFSGEIQTTDVQLTGTIEYTEPSFPLWSDVRLRADFETNTNNIVNDTPIQNPGTTLVRNTTTRKFGTASYGVTLAPGANGFYLIGSTRYNLASINADSPMTVEFWLYMDAGENVIVSSQLTFGGSASIYLDLTYAPMDSEYPFTYSIYSQLNPKNTPNGVGYTDPNIMTTWVHVASVREANGSERLYINGTLVEALANGQNNTAVCNRCNFPSVIITDYLSGGDAPCNGGTFLIDDLRISNAVVYTGQFFTPPTTPLPIS